MDIDAQGRLVVVDDEEVILELFRAVFSDEPWQTTFCSNGAEALAAMEAGVDVLLTDKNLPDVNGLDLVRHARTLSEDVECLIITGYASLDTALAALELEVFDYIVKPPQDIFEVRRKVKQAFQKQRVVRENRRLLTDLQTKNAALESALAELREVQQELIQSEKLAGIGTLAAGIAHEISSPLFGVMGLAEAILDEDDLGLTRDYAREIVDYSRQIKDIVVELTGYSRTSEREYLTTVELERVLLDAVRLVQRNLANDEVAFHISCEAGLYVHARTNEVQQVFVNLVKNAAEALAEWRGTGNVRIEAWREGGEVRILVADDGPGIDPDHVTIIFDPFYTTKPPGRGTGLGLNIVYRIMTKYRGTISVESQLEQGTTFHLRFPVADGSSEGGS